MAKRQQILHQRVEQHLRAYFGPLHWWPAETPFEVVVGAILTQNTAWTNVEYAIANLKRTGVMDAESLARLPDETVQELIRPAGFFRQKSKYLKHFSQYLVEAWQGDIGALCQGPLEEARNRLLALTGVGPETADSILLYAAGRSSFVVDSYTRRIFSRIGLLRGDEPYATIRRQFMCHLPDDAQLYNEHHAQIVELAKRCCRKSAPLCLDCPLVELCRYGREKSTAGLLQNPDLP